MKNLIILRGGESSPPEQDEEEEDYYEEEEEEEEETGLDLEELDEEFAQDSAMEMQDVVDQVDEWTQDEDVVVEDDQVLGEEPKVEFTMHMQENQDEEQEETPVVDVEDDPTIDEGDSSAFVDRMELADAYDEGETTAGGFELENDRDEERTSVSEATAAPVTTTTSSPEPAPEEEETPLATEEATTSSLLEESDVASDDKLVPTEITKDMVQALKELRYRREEISTMRPDIAALVVEKRLSRPMEGVPDFWCAGLPTKGSSDVKKIVARVVLTAVTGALAIQAGRSVDLDLSGLLSSLPLPTKKKKKTLTSEAEDYYDALVETALEGGTDDSVPVPSPPATATPASIKSDEIRHVNEHVNAMNEVHPHSIKPHEPPNDQLDVTWLDKGITNLERGLKRLFR